MTDDRHRVVGPAAVFPANGEAQRAAASGSRVAGEALSDTVGAGVAQGRESRQVVRQADSGHAALRDDALAAAGGPHSAGAGRDEVRLARAWLSRVGEPGIVALHLMLAEFGPVELVRWLRAGKASGELGELAAARAASDRSVADLAEAVRLGIRLVTPEDAEWPADQLQPMVPREADARPGSAPPQALWVQGSARLDELAARSVAIVGSRSATPYGERAAAELAFALAQRGWTIVSGGAHGIDGAAHRGCLAARGRTIAMVAGGLRRPYPLGHSQLFRAVVDTGLLVSEWPPDSLPLRHRFLVRNRLIAGLTAGTVVVEAAPRSGALGTARWATTYGRVLMAVPGPITSSVSAGCHEFIRNQEAVLVTRVEEVVELIGAMGDDAARPVQTEARPRDALDITAGRVLDGVPSRGAVSPEVIAVNSGVPPGEVLRSLPVLEIHGFVEMVGGGWQLTEAGRR
jgi:DNA processing protein